MTALALYLPLNATNSLINPNYIRKFLTYQAKWASGHGAEDDYLGCGMLYYALAYMRKAECCVCLGSGGGFVPRVMRQAQRDLNLPHAQTILIDADIGPWGRPEWLPPSHFFRKAFPDIEIIMGLTSDVAKTHTDWKIDYLHIDADHTFDGAYNDFKNFLPLMSEKGIITFHDTGGDLPCAEVISLIKDEGYDVLNFKEFGAGVAIIYLH